MKTLVFVLSLALGMSVASGQAVSVENPCERKTPTVGSCWECFQKLLSDCDKQNPEGDRRRACYTAANNYFTFCLGRTTQQRRSGTDQSLPTDMTYDAKNGMVYQLATDQGVLYDSIKVYLRVMVNGEPVQFEAPIFIVIEGDTTSVAVLPHDVGQNRWVGVVTTFRNGDQVVSAFADSVRVVDPFDLNGDGLVDATDLMEASNKINSGTMTTIEFQSFFCGWAARQ